MGYENNKPAEHFIKNKKIGIYLLILRLEILLLVRADSKVKLNVMLLQHTVTVFTRSCVHFNFVTLTYK